MFRLWSIINQRPFFITEADLQTVYVPLSMKEIPKTQLEETLKGWFYPELGWVTAYIELEKAIRLQGRWTGCERFPYDESVRAIVELQVPLHLTELEDEGTLKVELTRGLHHFQFMNVHITAKCMPGHATEVYLPGDLPFNGSIHEVISLENLTFSSLATPSSRL